MGVQEVYAIELGSEVDVFAARQGGREVAAAVGMDGQDLVRVATALSEVSRDVVASGGGRVVFSLPSPGLLRVVVTCNAVDRLPPSEDSAGLAAAGRLVDGVTESTDAAGHAVVTLEKRITSPVLLDDVRGSDLRRRLAASVHRSPLDELRTQNAELLAALDEAQARKQELLRVNAELEETNHGVLALYNELSTELEDTNRGVVALYAEIDQKNALLREASESKTRFLRNISHELRTPVNSVLGLARLLLDRNGVDPLTDEQRHQIEFINSSGEDLLRLVNELLDLAKAESGRIEPVIDDVDLATLFRELEGTTRPLITRDDVRLVVDEPTEVTRLRTDGTLLRHVLRNLLSNAVKFTEHGAITLAATPVEDGRMVRVSVRDEGIGISPEDQAKVFEEFYQVRGRLQTSAKGTGLGLAFARRVAVILGGDLRVQSTPGEGSTFLVELPVDGRPPSAADETGFATTTEPGPGPAHHDDPSLGGQENDGR